MEIAKHFNSLSKIRSSEKRNGIHLLLWICNNIIQDPNNVKYHTLDFTVITQTLKHCQPCIELLLQAGFLTVNKNKQLIFQRNKLNKLKNVQRLLLSRAKYYYNKDIITELVKFGYGTKEECIAASCACVNIKDVNEIRDKLDECNHEYNLYYVNQSENEDVKTDNNIFESKMN
eukprot:264486_1